MRKNQEEQKQQKMKGGNMKKQITRTTEEGNKK